MKKGETMTIETVKALSKTFEERAKSVGMKGKKALKGEREFMLGACRGIDIALGNDEDNKTCIPPIIAFSIMRGDRISDVLKKD